MSVNTTRIDRINYQGDQPWYARRNEIINTRTTVQAREKESAMKGWRGKREENAKGEWEKGCMRARVNVCVLVWAPHVSPPFLYRTTRTRTRMHLPTVSLLLMAAIRHPVYCRRGSVDISFVPRAPLHAGWGTIPDRVRAFDRTTTTRPSVLMHERG